eukprot:gene737-2518_t
MTATAISTSATPAKVPEPNLAVGAPVSSGIPQQSCNAEDLRAKVFAYDRKMTAVVVCVGLLVGATLLCGLADSTGSRLTTLTAPPQELHDIANSAFALADSIHQQSGELAAQIK